jgi:hypothetical protein
MNVHKTLDTTWAFKVLSDICPRKNLRIDRSLSWIETTAVGCA